MNSSKTFTSTNDDIDGTSANDDIDGKYHYSLENKEYIESQQVQWRWPMVQESKRYSDFY